MSLFKALSPCPDPGWDRVCGGEMEPQPVPGAEEKWEKGGRKRSQLPFILGPTCKHLLKDQ